MQTSKTDLWLLCVTGAPVPYQKLTRSKEQIQNVSNLLLFHRLSRLRRYASDSFGGARMLLAGDSARLKRITQSGRSIQLAKVAVFKKSVVCFSTPSKTSSIDLRKRMESIGLSEARDEAERRSCLGEALLAKSSYRERPFMSLPVDVDEREAASWVSRSL